MLEVCTIGLADFRIDCQFQRDLQSIIPQLDIADYHERSLMIKKALYETLYFIHRI